MNIVIAQPPNLAEIDRVFPNRGAGVIYAFIWKSWEGEMNMGGMRLQRDEHGNTSSAVNVFEFNVHPSMVAKVQAAQRAGTPVELVYRQWLIAPLYIDNDHVIIDVRH
jgi:hypothetical protein